MSEPTFPFVMDTIGKLMDAGSALTVFCNNDGCGNWTKIDLGALAARKGRDFGCMHWDLIKVFYCDRCRTSGLQDRNLSFIHNPRAERKLV